MYASPGEVIAIVARVLEARVVPAVADSDVRGQLWAAIGLLDNLAVVVDRDDEDVAAELQAVRQLLASAPVELGVDDEGAGDGGGSAALAAAGDRLGRALAAAGPGPRPPAVEEWMERCRSWLAAQAEDAVGRMRSTRYGRAVRGD